MGSCTRPSERAISPVIGVTLMLVIVLLLVSITAVFIFGLTDEPADPPKTSFEFDYDPDTNAVTIGIKAGNRITSGNTEKLEILVRSGDEEDRVTWAAPSSGVVNLDSDEISAAQTIQIDGTTGADIGDRTLDIELEKNDTILLIWYSPDDDQTDILVRDTVPLLADGSTSYGILDEDGTVVTGPGGAVGGDGGSSVDLISGGEQALGSTGDVDGDGLAELPYVDSSGNLKVNDSDGEVETLVDRSAVAAEKYPDTDKSLMATTSWQGSRTSVFYANENHGKIYRVRPGGSPQLVADVSGGSADGVNSVLGTGDIDGDGDDELLHADASQEIRYLNQDGTVETTGFTSGSSSGIGNGQLWDYDGDGKEEVVVVDGSNDVRLVDDTGAVATPAQSQVDAAKSPVTITDVDDDGENEIIYVDESTAELRYIDDVAGSPTVKTLLDEDGNPVGAGKDTGVVS